MATPAADGFRMPAEWEPHARCWMAWPCRADSWGGNLDPARSAYAEVANAISAYEPVTVLARPADVASASLRCGPGVDVLSMPLDDSWSRDTGPTFVVDRNGRVAGVDWRFNAWGGLFPDHAADAAVARRILEHLDLPRYQAPMVLEGGAIHADGEGTLLTTEDVVLNRNRNPGLTKKDAEALFADYLGVEQVLWLGQGLEDDETDGHVDNVACFVAPAKVLLLEAPKGDPNHARLEENARRLNGAVDARGREIEVVRLKHPPRRQRWNGERLALSHINFYIADGAVIMPWFEHPETDKEARRCIGRCFPSHDIVPIIAPDIVQGGGGIHCITQQQPGNIRN